MFYLVCIIAYLVMLAGIAVWKSREVKDQSDFAVAGRSLSPWMMVFIATAVELLILACTWITSSMTPDPENGKYIPIFAACHYLALLLGCLLMVTVVAIIISTGNSFLHVPATSVANDLYLPYINPEASQERIVWVSRLLVFIFGVIANCV